MAIPSTAVVIPKALDPSDIKDVKLNVAPTLEPGEGIASYDGGPTVTADTDDIRTVRESTLETVCEVADGGKTKALVAAGRLKDFRCCCASVKKVTKKGVCIDPEAAELLEIGVGDEILMVAR